MGSTYATQIKHISDTVAKLEQGQQKLVGAHGDLATSVAEIKVMVQQLHETCPHREEIARAANNRGRVEQLEQAQKELGVALNKTVERMQEGDHRNQLTLAKVIMIVIASGVSLELAGKLISLIP